MSRQFITALSGVSRGMSGGALQERRRHRAEKQSFKTQKWTANFSRSILRFSGVLSANLRGGEKKTDSPKPFWTTVSPHDAFFAPLARSDFGGECWDWAYNILRGALQNALLGAFWCWISLFFQGEDPPDTVEVPCSTGKPILATYPNSTLRTVGFDSGLWISDIWSFFLR